MENQTSEKRQEKRTSLPSSPTVFAQLFSMRFPHYLRAWKRLILNYVTRQKIHFQIVLLSCRFFSWVWEGDRISTGWDTQQQLIIQTKYFVPTGEVRSCEQVLEIKVMLPSPPGASAFRGGSPVAFRMMTCKWPVDGCWHKETIKEPRFSD